MPVRTGLDFDSLRLIAFAPNHTGHTGLPVHSDLPVHPGAPVLRVGPVPREPRDVESLLCCGFDDLILS